MRWQMREETLAEKIVLFIVFVVFVLGVMFL
jgi:hypothetical protein